MAELFQETVEALIDCLEGMKRRGVRFVAVSPETLRDLDQPVIRATDAPHAQHRAATGTLESAPPPQAPPPNPPPQAPQPVEAAESKPESPIDPDRQSAIAALRERALVCQKCPHLVRSRKQVVFGVGDIYSPLMFVGEAPGADEDEQGEPFVGRAGQLLTRVIQAMGYSRETVYIANVLKCRPDTPGQTSGNRKPTVDEMKTCLPYLLAQIDLIKPKVIVALGGTAMEGLFGEAVPITRHRGRFRTFRDTPVMPTYHPSYLLRNQSLKVKREVWEDMLQVLELLKAPISEKQRNYFLKAG